MTVKELRKALLKIPQDIEVEIAILTDDGLLSGPLQELETRMEPTRRCPSCDHERPEEKVLVLKTCT